MPKYGGGRPSKLTSEQKEDLKRILTERDDWTNSEIKDLIQNKFGVEYSLKRCGSF
ncbi:MAG: hypothetical protein FJ150_06230 [Euryarchaeota archaeon]|nr:hypothetical protein [Euryarchaeota archaeon]